MERPSFNLYVLDRTQGVLRVKLERPAQARLSELVAEQLAEFLDPERERHPYAPGFRPGDGGLVELVLPLPERLARLAPSTPSDVPVWAPAVPKHAKAGERDGSQALLAVDAQAGVFAFQALEARRLLGPSRPAILFDGRATQLSEVRGLLFGPRLDAVHSHGVLRFASESVVRRFLDLDGVFRAATDLEVRELFSGPLFSGFDGAVLAPAICDTWVRRRVMSVRLSGVCSPGDAATQLTTLLEAARRCRYALPLVDGRIAVPREKKPLKDLLKFLSEDYFDSPLRPGQVFEAGSKRPR